ncbi:amino acid transporter [plant metagenome]|uniref:Amino acid transporter n=2 Tax=root TaxID=1 RepID=A0A1C3K1L5_9BURK|nr:amino acid permease [Orrella dioscoreae]SBT25396.1 amino acid transporter [Orrella dioscoreae]SOE48883.1 amino acid transporter [Orrella dioscoreae]
MSEVAQPTSASPAASSPSSAAPDTAPRRLLGTIDVMALIIGIVIGAGIFSAPALVAANSHSVTEMMFAWLLGGLISIAGALCYAELATAHPNTGGDYHFLRLAYGDRLSFLFAWARLTVIPTGSIALLGFVFGDYATQVYSLGEYSSALYAAGMVLVLTAINLVGLRSGKWTQNFLTLLEVGGVLFIIGAGLFMTPDPQAVGALSPATREATQWGLILVFVMLTYGGWNEAAYVSAETVGANRNLPRALCWSLGIVTIAYLLVNLAFVRVLGLEGAGATDAVAADMLRALMGESGARIISVLIAVSALTSANATILLGARTIYAFGRDEPMFSFLGRWNARHDGPTNALVTVGLISLALVALGAITRSGFSTMVDYTAPVFWFFFMLTGIALFVLRRRWPDHPRPFKVPFYPFTPIVFVAICAYLLYSSVMYTGMGAFVGIGVLLLGAVLLLFRRTPPAASDPGKAS